MGASHKRRPRSTTGSITRLPSGRYHVRYTDPAGVRRSLPGTFPTKGEASAALARVTVATANGTWLPPEQATQTVGEYAQAWLSRRIAFGGLKPATVALYQELIRDFIVSPVAITGRKDFILGSIPITALKPALVTDWVVGVRDGIRERKAAKPVNALSDTAAARIWAKTNNIPVAESGRLSMVVMDAWRASGAPRLTPTPVTGSVGQSKAWQAYRLLHTICLDAVDNDISVSSFA